jgi:hypothetical protein
MLTFRAFDKFQNKYVFEDFAVIGEVTVFNCIDQEIQETWKERKEKFGYESSLEAFNDFIIEICSTVPDKNGKLIYQGDKVKSHYTDEISEIRFGEFYNTDSYASEVDYDDESRSTCIGFYWYESTSQNGIDIGLAFGRDCNGNTDKYEIVGNVNTMKF